MMTSSDVEFGLTNDNRPSSRVLKPPGGGHSNIFAEPEHAVNAPRPKYNQQNSSNLNACMNSTDPNIVVEKLREELTTTTNPKSSEPEAAGTKSSAARNTTNNIINGNGSHDSAVSTRGRVPPGGFSSGGFW